MRGGVPAGLMGSGFAPSMGCCMPLQVGPPRSLRACPQPRAQARGWQMPHGLAGRGKSKEGSLRLLDSAGAEGVVVVPMGLSAEWQGRCRPGARAVLITSWSPCTDPPFLGPRDTASLQQHSALAQQQSCQALAQEPPPPGATGCHRGTQACGDN